MSFVDQKRGPSPTGIASAIIVQAAIGAAVITGLSVAGGVVDPPEILDTWDVRPTPPPEPVQPPEPEVKPDVRPEVTTELPVIIPKPEFDFDQIQPTYDSTELALDRPLVIEPGPVSEKPPAPPAPVPTFDSVSAKPRNDPGNWLSDRDYKSAWARRELTGVASFRLDIAATGRVTGCRITGSTGHSELDQATCSLIQRRARFEPARGSNGEPVAGSFSSSVRWQLPN
ncbi:TonB family protein [Erythrobacter vulgaris]|uniref:TonB family protein n=1 Tax=Qipengyuania vulgaris TaxID=291985 RepID=A0A844XQK8_9SPHN|nr:energy transducer TonB [Qipengyuania vulgaris]MXO47826.1 TonB family protein [Qipengyuania vulgaris]